MSIATRRRALIGAQDDVLWEWNPSKGTSDIDFTASSGETPNYEVLSDCIRLYGPNASSQKWSGIATKTNLGFINFTVEVYYRNLVRKKYGSQGIIAATNGAGGASGSFGYASYYAKSTSSTDPSSKTLRGANVTAIDMPNAVVDSGVVKCHINRAAGTINASYPAGTPLTDSANTGEVSGKRVCSFEANRTTYYADITRIVVRRGDTT